MVISVPMPKLGAGVYHEGVILRWSKKVGERVNAGETLAEIETEKTVTEYASPASGTVLKMLFAEGETVEVGTPILLLGEPGEEVPGSIGPGAGGIPAASQEEQQKASGERESPATSAKTPDISPAARRLAENLNVDLSTVMGTGPGGSILREDVLKASRASRSARDLKTTLAERAGESHAASARTIRLSSMRQTIARRLVQSQRETAHVTLTRELEVSALFALIKDDTTRSKFGYNDVIVKATAEALRRYPIMNSRIESEDSVTVSNSIDIGVAVAVEGGLITPTVRGADKLSVEDISRTVKQLTERARSRQLSPDEYEGATFTISNLGAYGVEAFTPIINPPQVGILGIGRIAQRPWVEAGELSVAPTVHFSLTFDHRVLDGADAATFLDTLVRLVQDLSWLKR